MSKSYDYKRFTEWEIAKSDAWRETLGRWNNTYKYPTPRERMMYWKGNRRSSFHQSNKKLVNRWVRRYNEDTFWADGLSLPPYNRKCVRWLDD